MSASPLQTLGPRLIDAGFPIIAIHHGRKNPMGGKGWQDRPLTADMLPRYNGAGVGLLAAVGDVPIRPIDIDCPWPPGLQKAEALAFRILGATVQRVGEAPKQTLFYRAAEAGWPKMFSAKFTHPAHLVKRTRDGLKDEWKEKPGVLQIEFLGKGNQSVVYGIHPSTGLPFTWPDIFGGLACVRPEELPLITLEQEAEFRHEWEKWMRAQPEISEPHPPWMPNRTVIGLPEPSRPQSCPSRQAESVSGSLDITDLPSPRTDTPLERAVEMLAAVHPDTGSRLFDPNCQRPEWLRIGMALHHGYAGSADALAAWIDWSSGWSSWDGEGDCLYQWHNGMKDERRAGQKVVTMGTVIDHYNKVFGLGKYAPASPADGGKSGLADFLSKVEAATERAVLLRTVCPVEGPALLDGSDLYTVSEAVSAVLEKLKDLGGLKGVTKADVKGLITGKGKKETPDADAAMEGVKTDDETGAFLAGWWRSPDPLRGWAYVMDDNMFMDTATGRSYKVEAFDRSFLKQARAAGFNSASEWVHSTRNIPHANMTLYMPGQDPLFIQNGQRTVNLWSDRNFATVPPDLSDPEDKRAADLMRLHITYLCGGWNDKAILFCNYWGHSFRWPGRKIRWAPLLVGKKGTGKSFFIDFLKKAVGEANARVIDNTAVHAAAASGFNSFMANAQFAIINELKMHGHSKNDVANAVKGPISDTWISITPKGKELRNVPNACNWLLLSNFKDCYPMDDDERRVMVLWSVFPKDYIRLADPEYFNRLFGALATRAGAMVRFFLDVPFHKDFHPKGEAPRTEDRASMILQGADDRLAAVETVLAASTLWAVQPDILFSTHLAEMVAHHGSNRAGGIPMSGQEVNTVLARLDYLKLGYLILGNGIKGTVWASSEAVAKHGLTGPSWKNRVGILLTERHRAAEAAAFGTPDDVASVF